MKGKVYVEISEFGTEKVHEVIGPISESEAETIVYNVHRHDSEEERQAGDLEAFIVEQPTETTPSLQPQFKKLETNVKREEGFDI